MEDSKIYMFKKLWKVALIKNFNRFKFPLNLVEETSTVLKYVFYHINPQIGLEITMDEYCEIMITFDNPNRERMDHIVLIWEHYEALQLLESKIEQWLNSVVEYTQTFFTHEHSLIIYNKPEHYSYAAIVLANQPLEDSIEIFSIILRDS